jgi:periplasmic copper chaperone A
VKTAALCLGSILLTAGAGLANAAPAADAVQIEDAYVRAVPPGQPNSAAFMKLVNGSTEDEALVGAESPASDVAELHTHVREGGMMKMRRIDRIDLPGGKTTALQPGGLHVMLIGLKHQLVPGEKVGLTLIFADGSRQSVEAPVRRIGMPPMSGAQKGHQ